MNMDINKMWAKVTGVADGDAFTEDLEFTLIPPDESKSYYGTGYYMRVKTPYEVKLIDVRYERITDIEILADRWMKNWYGDNAKDISKRFK